MIGGVGLSLEEMVRYMKRYALNVNNNSPAVGRSEYRVQ